MSATPSLVCLGNFTIDDVVLPDGSERPGCTGGDALYATLAARPWEPSSELVAPVGTDFPDSIVAEMRRAGLDDAGLARRSSPTLHNRVEYFANGDREWTLFATEEEFDILSPLPADIPPSYRDAKGFMVLAMTLTAQQRLVADLKANTNAVVALDPQEDYIKGNEAALRELISKVDIFMPSAEEVVRLLGTSDWSAAARAFAAVGPKLVVIKLAGEGALLYDREREVELRVPAFSVADVVDTTGAGDSFCGAFMAAYLADRGDPERAARAGAVAASFTVAGYGVDPLFKADPAHMRRRLDEWRP
ncbi:carbohydrate kinase family protein [Mesorhizobium sp. KR1-2]|uniref:carbohydrate kinase family protein n=1 Tax=Mesorhizobium sp. KR1-2 TaxID=3156609 RepID=UPI0032B4C9A1